MHYYNEFDKNAVAWLRELLAAKLIPDGLVDARSISEIVPSDLAGFTTCHFFAGIGGWPLALRLAGWPDARPVWTGSCPCQPFSSAGRRAAFADPRHLWPVWQPLIAKCQPPTLFGEQTGNQLGRLWLAGIRADLEAMDYAVGAADLCSAGVGAPNIRQRLYWLADSQRAERRPPACGGNYQQHRPDRERETPGGFGNNGEARGLAQPASLRSEVRGNLHGEVRGQRPGQGRDPGRMASSSPGLERHAGDVGDRDQPGRLDSHSAGPASTSGESGGLDLTDSDGAKQSPKPPIPGSHGPDNGVSRQDGGLGFWSGYSWRYCRDDKHRRIPPEPAFFPLAPRLPGRVALLKGYGNAINPQLAAQFIRAYLAIT